MTTATVALRPITGADEPFLAAVYVSTRQEELAPLPWSAEAKTAFLHQQFAAQSHHYRTHFASADFDIILVDGCPAGRLYVERRADELRLIEIALLPAFRGAGIGTRLLQELVAEAAAAGKPLQLHVEKFNPALRLYERLGFRRLGDCGVYWFMEWHPTEFMQEGIG
jgi:ribosomal protein S18 acetylase RimI-like enzyme